MLKRNDNGRLQLKSLDVQIMIGDMFEVCNTSKEVEWLTDQLLPIVENIAEERNDELESEEELCD